jgi:hypothetical protein
MGSGSSMGTTQTQVEKQPRCSICNEIPKPGCTWRQGQCPHESSLLDTILVDPYRSRFYNLIKFFTGRR